MSSVTSVYAMTHFHGLGRLRVKQFWVLYVS